MKNALIFIAGMITGGGLLFFVFVFILSSTFFNNEIQNEEKTLFEKEGEYVSDGPFKIYKVFESGDALAEELRNDSEFAISTDLRVMLLGNEEKSYYDNQIIRVPVGKCAKQIGVVKNLGETLPIVAIRDK